MQGAQQIDGDGTGSRFCFVDGHARAELAGMGLPVFFGDVAGKENKITGANEGHIRSRRSCDGRQSDAELFDGLVNGHSVLL